MRYTKGKLSAERRRERAGRVRLLGVNRWIDPYPEVHGTLPEKMVYAELSRLGIPFLFLNDLRFKIPEIGFDKYYQADFVIPSLKLIIEVQGAYWHSKPKTVEADSFKFAIYETLGWKVIAWWDYDILSQLHNLVISTPELVGIIKPDTNTGKSSELPVQRRTKVDSSKGIRTLNARRRTSGSGVALRRNLRKARSTYGR